jgi:hypothetical protein
LLHIDFCFHFLCSLSIIIITIFRFFFVDVLRSQDNPDAFIFYELYENMEAVDFHKKQPHYQAWADFKESGGTVSSVSHKNDGEFVAL